MLNFIPSHVADALAHHHGSATTVGYVVRRTFFDSARIHEDVAAFRGNEYGLALECAREVRAESHDGYAVVDMVYGCGCRGMG